MPRGEKVACDQVEQFGMISAQIGRRRLSRRHNGVVVGHFCVVKIPFCVGQAVVLQATDVRRVIADGAQFFDRVRNRLVHVFGEMF